MSSSRKHWVIPPSYDIGVHFYYWNLLGSSEYVKRFLKEHIARIDRDLSTQYQRLSAGQSTPSDWLMSYSGFMDMLKQAGLDDNIINQITFHISHISGGLGKDVDYLKVKEFLAYCGVDGIYDLENKKHFVVEQIVVRPPETIDPQKYRVAHNCEAIREDIAYMMDSEGRLLEMDRNLRALEDRVWRDYLKQDESVFANNPDTETRKALYFESRPDMAMLNQQALDLQAKRDALAEELKDKFAPMSEDFTLPKVGTDFDKNWFDKGELEISQQRPFRERFEDYMEKEGKRKGDPEFDSFSWKDIRHRSFSIFDYAIREFSMNSTNKGEIADHRRNAIPRAFVKAVRDELDDGLLEILKLPYRIERHGDAAGNYAIICNDCVAEAFTLEQLAELEESLAKEDEELAKNAAPIKPSGFSPPPPSPVKPEPTPEELATIAADRLAFIKTLVTRPDGSIPHIDIKDPSGGLLAAKLASEESSQVAAEPSKAAELVSEDEPSPSQAESSPADAAIMPAKHDDPDDELPFPEAGLMGDASESETAKEDQSQVDQDKPVLEFENILPMVSGEPKSRKAKSASPTKIPEKGLGDRPKTAERKRDWDSFTRAEMRKDFAANQSNNSNLPSSVPPTGGWGIGFNFGGLRAKKGNASASSEKNSSNKSVQAFDSLLTRANRAAEIKDQIVSGVDATGNSLPLPAKVDLWKSLNNELESLQKAVRSTGAPKDEASAEHFKAMAKKMKETTEFAKSKANSVGQIGDLARQTQMMAEEVAKMIAKLLDGISKMFARSGPK